MTKHRKTTGHPSVIMENMVRRQTITLGSKIRAKIEIKEHYARNNVHWFR